MDRFPASQPLLPELIALHGKWRENEIALIFEEQRISWKELNCRVNRVANMLLDFGFTKGDRIAVAMSNGVPMFEVLLGVMAAGMVSVPLNLLISTESMLGMIEDAGARVLILSDDQRARIENEKVYREDFIFLSTGPEKKPFLSLEKILAQTSDSPPKVELHPNDILNIIYSSGTTGQPKGIVHTQLGRRDWAQDLSLALRCHSQSKILINIGLYSNISWLGILTTIMVGGTCVLHEKFTALGFLQAVEKEGVTHCCMVPVQFQMILQALKDNDFDVSSCERLTSVGSPLFEEYKKALFDKFDCGVSELYGLTEGIITVLDPEDVDGHWTSVGKPLLGTDIKIIGDDDVEVARGEKGEIVARGRICMPYYFNRPDATRDAIWRDENNCIWLRSGDIARFDDDNFIYIVDRKKDMILSGGQNIYPQDLEAIIIRNPIVEGVAVVGVKSTRWGETPVALVILKEGENIAAEEIKSWSNERLGRQQKLADVIFVDDFPRNANGKILKRELREELKGACYD